MAESNMKSPQEIEEGIKSTSTVAWDPFTVFPKEIYVKIFDKLESPTDKRNFMNAHTKFYDLFKSKRTTFLLKEVLNLIERKQKDPKFKDYQQCRLVCHDWDNAIQNFFQLHPSHFMIGEDKDIWMASCYPDEDVGNSFKDFCWYNRDGVEDLKKFSVTHPPSKNPFFSRKITLQVHDWEDTARHMARLGLEKKAIQKRRYKPSVDALLERYGCHVWHCKIKIYHIFHQKTNFEALSCIAKWLGLMPELKTLEIYNENCVSEDDLRSIQDMQVVQPELKNLVFLKIYGLQSVVFNKLVGNLNGLKTIQLKASNAEESIRNFAIFRENLKEAFLTLECLEDFEYLQDSEPFPNLKKLTTTFTVGTRFYSDWPEWRMIFKVLEDKFPALDNLTLRLPIPMFEEDKRAAIDHSLECQLNLPKLKKLRLNVSNLCSLDFLSPCKALEELRVILEHSEWGLEDESMDLRIIRRDEKTNFNMDLENMWESNIWEAFPNLRKLKIWAWRDSTKSLERYIYEKMGEERKYDQRSYVKRDEDAVYSDSD